MSELIFFGWLEVLDDLTYYELFGIRADASPDDVRSAFHSFCDTFHPDRHFARADDERTAVSTIFKRGTEAYLVLSDLGLREQYDAQLMSRGDPRPQRVSFSLGSRPPSSRAASPPTLADAVSPSAQPFARRAEELIQAGDLRQAKLQLVMANYKEPNNAALEAALQELEARLAPRK
jgi:curved DNA-binding protein CbpA